MPTNSYDVFVQNGEIQNQDMQKLLIQGGSEVVIQELRNNGWDGSSPTAAVGLMFEDDGGIKQTELFLMGTKEAVKLDATTLFGGERHENDYVKINSIDLSMFLFKGSLVSEWIENNEFEWVYRKYNPDTQKYKETSHLDENGMKHLKINKLHLRCHLTPITGLKLQVKIGVASCNNVEDMAGFSSRNFPIIAIGKEFHANLAPEETENEKWGIGLKPFLIQLHNSIQSFPSSMSIKESVSNLLRHVIKPTMKTKFKTWNEVVGAGSWEEVATNYAWPEPLQENRSRELGKQTGPYKMKTPRKV